MRLSLWQQFSSNHSASFTIIGIFKSAEAANNAAEKVEAVLQAIREWHHNHPRESEELWDSGELTPVEQEFSQQHNIEWDNIWWAGYRLTIYKQFVLISSAGQVDTGAYPINKLFEKLGGEVMIDGDIFRDFISGDVTFEIICTASTPEIAVEVAALTNGKLINSPVKIKIPGRKESYVYSADIGSALIRILKVLDDKKCSIYYFGSSQRRGHFIDSDK